MFICVFTAKMKFSRHNDSGQYTDISLACLTAHFIFHSLRLCLVSMVCIKIIVVITYC